MEYLLMLLSVLARLRRNLAEHTSWYIQRPRGPRSRSKRNSPFLYKLLFNQWYVDQIYDAMFVNRVKDLALTLGSFDVNFINGLGRPDGSVVGDASCLEHFPVCGIHGLWTVW